MQQTIEEEQTEQPLANLGSLNVSQLIKASQSQNGLKHADYGRYRRYCVHKVKRIRKTMKFSYGKKYHTLDITKERQNDPKLLHVLLYNAERHWSYAMALKSQMTSEVQKKKTNRIKFHLRKQFKRAVKWAQQLQSVCEHRTERRSALEAESYASFLSGMYYFELEQWEQAQASYIKSRSIYSELLKISDSLQGVLYRDRIDQIDQSIRYCSHKASKGKSLMTIENILEMKQQIKDPSLIAKLEELLDEHRTQQLQSNQGLLEVSYHGEKYPVKNPRVIIVLQKIAETNFNIGQNNERINQAYHQALKADQDPLIQLLEQNFDNYISLFTHYDEATKQVTKDKEDVKNSDSEKLIYGKVLSYLSLERTMALLDRNDAHIKQAILRFVKEDGLNNLQNLTTKKALKLKLTTPQEIVKHCDNYLTGLKQLMDVERMNPDLTLFKRLDVLEYFGKATRCFFVAAMYFSNGKYKESVSLLQYDDGLFKTAVRKYLENVALFPKINLQESVHMYQALSAKLQLQCKLNALKEQHSTETTVGQKLGSLSLEQNQGEPQEKKSLFSVIRDQDTIITLDNVLTHKTADLSTQMQLITPKPIQFDLAYNSLTYPELEKKEEVKKGGFWGKLNIFKK